MNEIISYWKEEKNENKIIVLVHLSGILFCFLVPLIVYLFENKNSNIYQESTKALNFQITLLIISILSWFENHLPSPIPLSLLVFLLGLFLTFKVAYEVSEQLESDYKISFPFLK